MVERRCDKCGAKMDPPNTFVPFFGCSTNDTIEKATIFVSRRVGESTFVPVDLCEKCEKAVHDFIFEKDNWVGV